MEHGIQTGAFVATACFAVACGLIFIVNLLLRRRQIDPLLALYVTGAVVTVGVGSRICYIWLGVNFPLGYTSIDFWEHLAYVLHGRPYFLAVCLFGALTGHFAIYALGRVWMLARTHRFNLSSTVHLAAATSVMLCVVLMTYGLWHGLYRGLVDARIRWERENEQTTEQYLQDWLRAEPDCQQAKQLLQRFMERKSGDRTRSDT